eukprot:403366122
MRRFLTLLSSLSIVAYATVLTPPVDTVGKDVAVILLQGSGYAVSGYTPAMQKLQQEASQAGLRVFASLPEFPQNKPTAKNIDAQIKTAIQELKSQGFTSDQIYLAAHGQVTGQVAQNYAKSNGATVKGLILEGSAFQRSLRHIQSSNGLTKFDYQIPTLTVCGELDGLMRISRCAEAHYHQVDNIDATQKGLFPVVALKGVSHWRFSSGAVPDLVQKNDFQAEIEETEAHSQISKALISFISQQIGNSSNPLTDINQVDLTPLVSAMTEEGSQFQKKICDSFTLKNVPAPDCLTGSPFISQRAMNVMAGDIPNSLVSLENDDQFHLAYTVYPYHHPQFNNTCADATIPCTLYTITTTENIYDSLSEDNGLHPVGATEMKTKFKSRQEIWIQAGKKDADYHQLDEVTDRCKEINEDALQWAYDNSSPEAKQRYDQFGQKLSIGADLGPYNDGPSWIWRSLQYNQSKDKKTVVVQSPAMKFKSDFILGFSAGIHYCKVLSPFRAMEWIYFDSLKLNYGVQAKQQLVQEQAFLQ